MALDGIVVASLAKELQENFTNARLSKSDQTSPKREAS